MYLICLSGTLAVFHHEWERWQQPGILEGEQLAPEQLQQAYEEVVSRMDGEVQRSAGGRRAGVPGRLIYAEQYRFNAAGDYLDHAGFSDGQPGQQFMFSLFRLHFGHFGGLPMQLLFLVGGLALSMVAVTGINVWLHKRKQRDALVDGDCLGDAAGTGADGADRFAAGFGQCGAVLADAAAGRGRGPVY